MPRAPWADKFAAVIKQASAEQILAAYLLTTREDLVLDPADLFRSADGYQLDRDVSDDGALTVRLLDDQGKPVYGPQRSAIAQAEARRNGASEPVPPPVRASA
jgi:hypothetical protein